MTGLGYFCKVLTKINLLTVDGLKIGQLFGLLQKRHFLKSKLLLATFWPFFCTNFGYFSIPHPVTLIIDYRIVNDQNEKTT